MKTKQLLLLELFGLEIIAIVVATYIFNNYFTDLKFVNFSLIASLNMIGTMIGLSAGIVITFQEQNKNSSKIYLLLVGLLTMGILQGFGAVKSVDNTTTFLRSIGSLIGSLFFIFTLLPEIEKYIPQKKWFSSFIAICSVLLGVWGLFFRNTLPVMINNNSQFTNGGIAINVISGLLFIITACKFLGDFLKSDKLESYFIATMCLLFGLSGIMYFYCTLWSPIWWSCNLLRAVAYIIGSGLLVESYLHIISDVKYVLTEHEKIQEGLIKTKEWFKLVIDTSHEAFVSIDTKGEIIYWNHEAEKTFGWSQKEALGKRMVDLIIPKEYREAHEKGFKHYTATGQGPILDKRIEVPAQHRDGHIFPIEITIRGIRLGNAITANAFLHDITDRKKVEDNFKTYQTITELLTNASLTVSEAISKTLSLVCEITGWQIGEFWRVDESSNVLRCIEIWHKPQLKITELIAESKQLALPPSVGLIGKVWSSGNPLWVTELIKESDFKLTKIARNLGMNGNFAFPVKFSNKVIGVINFYDYESKPPNEILHKLIVNIGIQIGEFLNHNELKEKLHLGEERLGIIFNSSTDAIYFCALDGNFVDVNEAYVKLTGYSKEELLSGRKSQDITPPEYYEFEAKIAEEVVKSGKPAQFKKEYIRKDGSLVPVLLTMFLVNGANGKPTGIGAFIRDMSNMNQSEIKWPSLKRIS